MVIGEVTLELSRTGDTGKLTMTVLKKAVEAPVTLPHLEAFALYLASEVGVWRDEHLDAEGALPQREQQAL